MKKKIVIFPERENFKKIFSLVDLLEKDGVGSNDIYIIGNDDISVEITARLYGFSFIPTELNNGKLLIDYNNRRSYGKKREYISCFAQRSDEGVNLLISGIKPDYILYSEHKPANSEFERILIDDFMQKND